MSHNIPSRANFLILDKLRNSCIDGLILIAVMNDMVLDSDQVLVLFFKPISRRCNFQIFNDLLAGCGLY